MDLTSLLLLLFLYGVVNLLFRGRQQAPDEPEEAGAPPPLPHPERPPVRRGPPAKAGGGTELERLLEAFEEEVRTARRGRTAGPMGRRTAPLEGAEEIEERGSLEVEPVVESLEVEYRRPQRAEVDHDRDAEEVVRRRVAWAEAQARPLRSTDHEAFDRRIREPSTADDSAARAHAARIVRLRTALIMAEVLGRPRGR